MSRMPSGLRRVSAGWKDPFHRKSERKAVPSTTPEQMEQVHKRRDEFLRSMAPVWGVAPEDVDMWINDPAAYGHIMDQQRALAKIVDHHARVAVEGDTDLNHDNVEVAE